MTSGPQLVTNGVPHPPVVIEEPRGREDESRGEYVPGEVLSPSSVNSFFACGFKWHCRHVLDLPDIQGSARCIGKATHATVRENYAQKCETHIDLPLSGVMAVYKDAWVAEEKETEFRKDEDRAELRAMGAKLVTKYIEAVAPLIEPAKVEYKVEGVIAGVLVKGYIDLLDVHGRIIDLKTAKTSPPKGKIRSDYRFQVATYAAIEPKATGEAELHTVVKLAREIKIVPQSFTVTDADRLSLEKLYPLAQANMRDGYANPNRNSFLCSKKYCSYWKFCEQENGGTVPE